MTAGAVHVTPAHRSRPVDTEVAARLDLQVDLPATAVRLRLRSQGLPSPSSVSLVDGGWWPSTDDLGTALLPLLDELARRGYVAHRVNYSLDAWPGVPRKLLVGGTQVRLCGYRTQPRTVIHLVDTSGRSPLVLVVVPSGTSPSVAARALHLSTTSTRLDADAVLEAAGA